MSHFTIDFDPNIRVNNDNNKPSGDNANKINVTDKQAIH